MLCQKLKKIFPKMSEAYRRGMWHGYAGHPTNQLTPVPYAACSSMAENFTQNFPSTSSSFMPNRPGKHPPHLRGRAIGMFYANKNKKKRGGDRITVSMDDQKEEKIVNILHDMKYKDSFTQPETEYSTSGYNIDLKYCRYLNDIQGQEDGFLPKYDPLSSGLKRNLELDERLDFDLEEKQFRPEFISMQRARSRLPAHEMQKKILETLEQNQVIVISGETGCGKTTQVGQFILDSYIKSKKGSLCKVICTQPRRISAISVAERVAEERLVSCGENSDVGYQIRLESKMPRDQGSILFCTTGILLKKLQSDPYLPHASHIIMDEVHERDLQSDFLLIILKDVIKKRKDLKIILMSATLNSRKFSAYFGNCPMIEILGFTYPVEEFYLEDIIDFTQYQPQNKKFKFGAKENKFKRKKFSKGETDCVNKGAFLRNIRNKYSRQTVDILEEWDEKEIDLDLIVHLLKHINRKLKNGAVLVFLPGWQDISRLHKLLVDDYFFSSSRFLIIPLHSLMPTSSQRDVFRKPPGNIQKIILSTNIAETSITIDDVVHVIDCGKTKLQNFDSINNITTLKPEWIALSNAKQRRGRAGRTQPGFCYHLFTSLRSMELEAYQLPEMLRTRLEELILKIKILKLGKVVPFLGKAMEAPEADTVELSLTFLRRLNALREDESLTPLGYHLAQLPVDPITGKMILLGAMFSCLDPILSIAASLGFKDAFTIPLGKEQLVDKKRKALSRDSQSDHLMLAYAFQEWERAKEIGNDRQFCYENFLSSNTLQMLAKMKQQFAQYLHELHFLDSVNPKHPDYNRNSGNELLLKAIVCAGLYPNIAKVPFLKKFIPKFNQTRKANTEDGKLVFLHPKSVNAYEEYIRNGWLAYHIKIKSSHIYLHDTTIVSAYSLLFFGGQLKTQKLDCHDTVSVDDWIVFNCPERKAALVQELRGELDNLLRYKISNPGVTNWSSATREGYLLKNIIELITSEETLKVPELNYCDKRQFDSNSEM